MEYKYDFLIKADTEKLADEKMKALTILAHHLKANELTKLAHVVKHNPSQTRMAKLALGL